MATTVKSVTFAVDDITSSDTCMEMYPTPASKALENLCQDNEHCHCVHIDPTHPREYILYFIRHGEAMHNILEKEAESKARQLAVSQGYDPNSHYVKKAAEDARKAILNSQSMEDPPLSEQGMKEARRAKRDLEQLISSLNLPPVQEVWVSPLQRALKTASIIFPNSLSTKFEDSCDKVDEKRLVAPRIKVKEELKERHTGLACDTHSPLKSLRARPSFQYFSLSGLRLNSMESIIKGISSSSTEKMDSLEEEKHDRTESSYEEFNSDFGLFRLSGHPNDNDLWEQLEHMEISPGSETKKNYNHGVCGEDNPLQPSIADDSWSNTVFQKEDNEMLRERTKKLFDLLAATESRSICLVGHKGYLRELERGPLGHSDAELFQNCEVRVYRLLLNFVKNGAPDVGVEMSGKGLQSGVNIFAERITSSR
ncbi:hypothetical protein HJC23_002555 [Cyclotella cryptica]|uniref:Phosphoglycerate mutase n=1 Tax=Cyclotella cryptica TaxID=29204 RepID=A0ABD3QY90_9STRA|eukprot:CCRYP_001414-RA/>CCRYP_001414-RA protein AED:0.01 eAED:0.01 QI:157/1/1/1/0.5/0.33/3/1265/424